MRTALLSLGLAAVWAGAAAAQARQGGVYEISPDTLDSSGGPVTGGVYSMVTGLQAVGGSTSGGAYTLHASFTGQLGGIATGGPGAAAFIAWQTAIFGSPNAPFAGANDDPDKDAVTNLFEFVFNMDPLEASFGAVAPGAGTSGLPLIRVEGAGDLRFLTVEYIRLKAAAVYSVQASQDLDAWATPALTILSQTSVSTDYERVKVRVNPVLQPGEKRFARVKVLVE